MFPFPSLFYLIDTVARATAITTSSIGIALVGATAQLGYTVTPTGAPITDIQYTTSDATKMTIDANGLMTFVAEGGFDAGMTAKNSAGTTLSDSSGGYVSELSVYTESLETMTEGTTQQLVATIEPDGAAALPDMVIEYTTTDATIATVDNTGLITAVLGGDCRIGCTATYQGTVTASDSSYLEVASVIIPEGDIQDIAIATYQAKDLGSLAVLTTGNELYTQGLNNSGECGTGNKTAFYDVLRKSATDVKRVFGGEASFIIQKLDGTWWYCGQPPGSNQANGTGVTAWTAFTLPAVIPSGDVSTVVNGIGASLWLLNNKTMYGFGANINGQVGNNTVTNVPITTPRLMSNNCVRAESLNRSTGFIEGSNGQIRQSGFKGTYDTCCAEVHSHYAITTPGGWAVDFSGGTTGSSGTSFANSLLLRKATSTDTVTTAHYRTAGSAGGWPMTYSGDPFTTISLVHGSAGNYAIVDGNLKQVTSTGPVGTFSFGDVPPVPQFGAWDADLVKPIHSGSPSTGTDFAEISVYNGNLMYRGKTPFFGKNTASVSNFTYIDNVTFVDA